MKNCKENQEGKNHTLLISTITSAVLSVCLLVSVIVVAVMKIRSNKKHDEKWKDYDECGI